MSIPEYSLFDYLIKNSEMKLSSSKKELIYENNGKTLRVIRKSFNGNEEVTLIISQNQDLPSHECSFYENEVPEKILKDVNQLIDKL